MKVAGGRMVVPCFPPLEKPATLLFIIIFLLQVFSRNSESGLFSKCWRNAKSKVLVLILVPTSNIQSKNQTLQNSSYQPGEQNRNRAGSMSNVSAALNRAAENRGRTDPIGSEASEQSYETGISQSDSGINVLIRLLRLKTAFEQ